MRELNATRVATERGEVESSCGLRETWTRAVTRRHGVNGVLDGMARMELNGDEMGKEGEMAIARVQPAEVNLRGNGKGPFISWW